MVVIFPLRYQPRAYSAEVLHHRWSALGILSVLGLLTYPLPSAWLGLAGLITLAAARWRRKGRPFPSSAFAVPLGLYLVGAAVGLYATVRPQTAEVRFFGLLAALGTFFLVLDLVTSAPAAGRLARAATIAALAAALPLFVASAPTLRIERVPRPLSDLAAPFVEPADPSTKNWLGPHFGQRYRLTPSGLGALGAYGVGLALGPLLAGASGRARLLGSLAMGYFGLILIVAGSRGAIVSAVLVTLLLAALRHRWLLAGAVLITVLTIGAISGLVRPETEGPIGFAFGLLPEPLSDPGPIYVRLEFWQNALFLLGDFSLTGVGLGVQSVRAMYQAYFLPVDGRFTDAHNAFLQTYLEQGLFGLAGLVGLVVVGLVVGLRTLARARDPLTRPAAISASGAALALVLADLTAVVSLTSVGMVLLFGALALTVAVGRLEEPSQEFRPPAIRLRADPSAVGGRGIVARLALLVGLHIPTAALIGAGPPPAAPAHLDAPLRAVLGELYLNLGTLDLGKTTVGEDVPRREREQRLDRAEGFLNAALELDPTDLRIYRNLAAAASARSQPVRAQRLLAEAQELAAPDDSRFIFQLGRLYRDVGDVDQAILAWSSVDPALGAWTCASADVQLIQWGTDLVQRGLWKKAVDVNQAAIRTAPTEAMPYHSLAVAASAQRGKEAALAVMRELTQTYPDVPWAYAEVAKLYDRARRSDEARAWNQKAETVRASSEWMVQQQRASRRPPCDELLLRRWSK